jgi:hypothetical protein
VTAGHARINAYLAGLNAARCYEGYSPFEPLSDDVVEAVVRFAIRPLTVPEG